MLSLIEHDDQVDVVNRPDLGSAGQAARWYDINDVRQACFQLPDENVRRHLASSTPIGSLSIARLKDRKPSSDSIAASQR